MASPSLLFGISRWLHHFCCVNPLSVISPILTIHSCRNSSLIIASSMFSVSFIASNSPKRFPVPRSNKTAKRSQLSSNACIIFLSSSSVKTSILSLCITKPPDWNLMVTAGRFCYELYILEICRKNEYNYRRLSFGVFRWRATYQYHRLRKNGKWR